MRTLDRLSLATIGVEMIDGLSDGLRDLLVEMLSLAPVPYGGRWNRPDGHADRPATVERVPTVDDRRDHRVVRRLRRQRLGSIVLDLPQLGIRQALRAPLVDTGRCLQNLGNVLAPEEPQGYRFPNSAPSTDAVVRKLSASVMYDFSALKTSGAFSAMAVRNSSHFSVSNSASLTPPLPSSS